MPFPVDEVEDGTGKPTATVYEQHEAAASWLLNQGYTKFDELDDLDQQAAMRHATSIGEDALRPYFRGVAYTTGQGLLFPAIGAYGGDGVLLDPRALPVVYLQAIRLLAEHHAAGTLLRFAGGPPGIKEERSRQGAIVYRDGVDFSTVRTNHPEVWNKLLAVMPP